MPTPGEHDQSPSADVRDQRLLVEDQRIGLPPPVAPCLEVRQPAFELGGALDLPDNQNVLRPA
jgi:hypothetical protein